MNEENGIGTEGNKTAGDTNTKDVLDVIEETYNEDEIDNIEIVDEDELLANISESLASQICSALDTGEGEIKEAPPKKRRWPKIAGISALIVVLSFIFIVITPFGQNLVFKIASNYAYGRMTYNDGSDVVHQEVEDDVDEVEEGDDIPELPVDWDISHTEDGARSEKGIVNILLLGEEAIDSGGGRGRTDIMIIATMNTKSKKVKLTSLMRDILVQIPGYKDNKLNAAYEIGGVPLLYETIELNFDIKLDGYVLVGFDSFERIIDKLGGVRIELSASEAKYLRNTNYISKPQYRNVQTGSQVLNGNQALGYCRIRYVSTKDKQHDDYGRTSRQREVLNAIFDAYKSKNLAELALLMNDILPMLTTDIKKEDFDMYLKAGVTMGLSEIDDLRIPINGGFENGSVRKMSVLITDFQKNIEELHKFVFEDN